MSLVQGFKGLIVPNGVSLNASTASLGNGATYQLIPTITPAGVTNNKIHWTSSDTSKATVDSNGLVTGTGDGSVTITATTDYGGYTASCTFTVYTIHVTGITLNESEFAMSVGDTLQLEATITPSDATNKNVTRRSTDTSIATVDNNGLVTYIDDGECQIMATTVDGNYTASCDILPGLPSDYQQVEWIQSSGSQVIKTGVYITEAGYRADIDFQITSSSASDQAIIGFYNNENGNNSYRCGYGPNNGFTMSSGASSLNRQTAIGDTLSFSASSYQIYIFAKQRYTNGNYDSNATGKVYSCQIYGPGGTLIRDFIPCYRKSDGVIGLWDKVGKQFYTNQGSGTFTKGQDIINIKDVQEVEYIQSSGNGTNNGQFIKPEVPVSSGIELKIQTKFTNLNSTTDEREVFATCGGGVNLQCNVTSSAISINNWSSYTITPNTTSNGTTHILEAIYTGGSSSSRNPFLFAQNEGDSYGRWCCSIKLYYFKIYQNNVLVRDFMPCYRKSDNVIGLFDKVNNIFYTNQGSGTFTAGPKLGVSLDTNSISLTEAGQTYQLTATPNPSSVGAQGYQWRSSDTTIATVSNTGLVTCVTPGECTITVTAVATGDTDTCSVVKAIEASYDFRTLSLSELQAQGWASGSQTRLDSNGLMNNNSGTDKYDAVLYCPIDISQANHLYLKWTGYWVSGSWASGSSLGMNSITRRDSGYRFQTSMGMNNNSGYRGQSIYLEGGDLVNQQVGLSTGDYTIEFDIDFTTGAVSSKRTGPTTFEQTATLNATQISNVKTNTKYILSQVGHGYYQAHRIYTMEYVIT